MTFIRRLSLVVVLGIGACCAIGAPRALSATPPAAPPSCPDPMVRTLQSPHFEVDYSDDPLNTGHITQAQAGTILAAAERSYATDVADGFPTPLALPSGRTMLSIEDLATWKLASEYCPGAVVVDSTTAIGDNMAFTIGVDVFTQVEYRSGGSFSTWLMNGAAAWASWRALGYPAAAIADIGPFNVSLDCDSASDMQNCSTNGYENLGESRWPFYEYLTEKYGPLFIINIFNAVAAVGDPDINVDALTGLQNAIAAKGSTLGADYAAYTAKLLSGGWSATMLNAAVVPPSSTIPTGISSGSIPTQTLGINHLATSFVEIDRGDGSNTHPCYAATLTLNVQIPAGVTSQPTFYWAVGGSTPVPLTVNGNTATTTVPWDTCAWTSRGYLSLPNTSLVNGTSFVVSGTLTVDFSTPASSTVPPAPVTQFGTPIVASSYFSNAPTVSLFGPSTLTLLTGANRLFIGVHSSDEGTLDIQLGSLTLGTMSLVAGTNTHTFTVSAAGLSALQLAGAGGLSLTLTPQGLLGKAAKGTVVLNNDAVPASLRITSVQAAKATKSAKAKAKPKHAPPAKKKTKRSR
jgi:hypothetical protein